MRGLHRLTALEVERMNKPGKKHDGGGLYLRAVARVGEGAHGVAKSWLLRTTAPSLPNGKRGWRWGGLGSYPDVSLGQARAEAAVMRKQHRDGLDPILERSKLKAARRAEALRAHDMDAAFAARLAKGDGAWKGNTSRAQWQSEWKRYVSPIIGSMLVNDIDVPDVMRVVHPLWTKWPVLADRILSRVEAVLEHAIAAGWRLSPGNPAERARTLLPKHADVHQAKSYEAMAEDELVPFMARLRASEGLAAAAIELLVLTGVRSNELLGMEWEELHLDCDAPWWTIPAARMKGRRGKTRDHFVPLSTPAVARLAALRLADASGPVFAGLTRSAFGKAFKRTEPGNATLHGFRSCLSSWANKYRIAPSDVIEAALAHSIGGKVARTYDRDDRRDPRRLLMQAWANFLGRVVEDNVTKLHA